MKHLIITLTTAVFSLGLVACGPPSPEKVCNKAMEAIKADAAKKATEGGMAALAAGVANVALDAAKPVCIAQLNAAKKSSPEAYKKVSECIMAAKTPQDFGKCAMNAAIK